MSQFSGSLFRNVVQPCGTGKLAFAVSLSPAGTIQLRTFYFEIGPSGQKARPHPGSLSPGRGEPQPCPNRRQLNRSRPGEGNHLATFDGGVHKTSQLCTANEFIRLFGLLGGDQPDAMRVGIPD